MNKITCKTISDTDTNGSVAEWSKALVLGTSHFDGVGSNPTAARKYFFLLVSQQSSANSYALKEALVQNPFRNTTSQISAFFRSPKIIAGGLRSDFTHFPDVSRKVAYDLTEI